MITVGEAKEQLNQFFDDEPLVIFNENSGTFSDIRTIDYEDNDNDEDIDHGIVIFCNERQ